MKHVLLVTVCPACDGNSDVIWLNAHTILAGVGVCRCGNTTFNIVRDAPEVCKQQTAELVSQQVLGEYLEYIAKRLSALDNRRAVEEAERIVRGEEHE